MKNTPLLAKLAQQLAVLSDELAPVINHQTLRPRFDNHLFNSQSTQMADYFCEIQTCYQCLQAACEQNDALKVAWLAEHLINQMTALRRECATWQLRVADSAHLHNGQLHEAIIRHQGYEQRLAAMVIEREARLAQEITMAGQQQCLREVEIYQQRLARCRQALDTLNRRLARISR